MITLPFHPQYTILLSTRNEGSVTTAKRAQELIRQAGCTYPIGYLKLQHGSQRVHWKDDVTDNEADAVITDNQKLCLAMVVGDCFPVIIIEPKKHVLAMIHGGWRSLLQNIIPLTMKELKYFHYKAEPENLIAWIGPGLRAESNVFPKPPVQAQFPEWYPFVSQSSRGYHVDLAEYIKQSLVQTKLKAENVFDYDKNTYTEKEAFYSYRRSQETRDDDGRFLVAVWRNEK